MELKDIKKADDELEIQKLCNVKCQLYTIIKFDVSNLIDNIDSLISHIKEGYALNKYKSMESGDVEDFVKMLESDAKIVKCSETKRYINSLLEELSDLEIK